MKVEGLNPDFEAVQSHIIDTFPGAILKESHCNMLMVNIAESEVNGQNKVLTHVSTCVAKSKFHYTGGITPPLV